MTRRDWRPSPTVPPWRHLTPCHLAVWAWASWWERACHRARRCPVGGAPPPVSRGRGTGRPQPQCSLVPSVPLGGLRAWGASHSPSHQRLLQTCRPQSQSRCLPELGLPPSREPGPPSQVDRPGGPQARGGRARASLLTGAQDVQDVGEKVVVLRLGHGRPQLSGLQELGDQDAQAVLVRELGRQDLKDGLGERTVMSARPQDHQGPVWTGVWTSHPTTRLWHRVHL